MIRFSRGAPLRATLAILLVSTLTACMTPTVQGTPLTGQALDDRLRGQVLTLRPDFPELGTPTRAVLFSDGRVTLDFTGRQSESHRWRVEGQGLCFSGRGDPDRFFCRNVVVGETGNVANVYESTAIGATRIATGTLSPIL